jgi:hypothetical protein
MSGFAKPQGGTKALIANRDRPAPLGREARTDEALFGSSESARTPWSFLAAPSSLAAPSMRSWDPRDPWASLAPGAPAHAPVVRRSPTPSQPVRPLPRPVPPATAAPQAREALEGSHESREKAPEQEREELARRDEAAGGRVQAAGAGSDDSLPAARGTSRPGATAFLAAAGIQPALRIGARDDPAEREADDVSEDVAQRIEARADNEDERDEGEGTDDEAAMGVARDPEAVTVAASVIRRQCACGATCKCEAARDPDEHGDDVAGAEMIRRKISIGPADDEMEKEARETAAQASATESSAEESSGAEDASTDSPDTDTEDDQLVPEGAGDVQMKPAMAAARPGSGEASPAARLEARLATAERSGRPLEAAAAQSMGAAFGADFADVRVHVDAEAAELASSIGASAFTHGKHVYFGAGAFDPGTHHGRRLLAHELTHVVQQRPDVRLSRPPPPPDGAQAEVDSVVRRAGPRRGHSAAGKRQRRDRLIGQILVFDDEKAEKSSAQSNLREDLNHPIHLAPGRYDATASDDGKLVSLDVDGKHVTLESVPSDSFRDALVNAKRIQVVIGSPGAATGANLPKKTTGPGVDKPPPEGGAGTEDKKKERTGEKGGDEKGQEEGKKEATGRRGSKYGWLGLIDLDFLPPSVLKALETLFEALGDSQEYLALRETLMSLQEMWQHRSELVNMFSSGENLLDVALGIRESALLDDLAKWAMAAPPKKKAAIEAPHKNRKGIAALAKRVLDLVAKVRLVAKPVFVARQRFMDVFDGLLAIVEEVPALEELFDAGNIPQLGKEVFNKIATRASKELGQSIQDKLEAAEKTFNLVKTVFGEGDLVQYEDVARALVAAAELAAPASAQPFIKAAKFTNLDTLVADNMVANLIPKEVLDGINDIIRGFAKTLEPAISEAEKAVAEVIGRFGEEFAKKFPKQIEDLFSVPVQRDRRAGAAAGDGRASGGALERADGLLRSSAGQPLPPDVGADMQDRLGFSFDDVRIHTGTAAAAAADLLGANALTHGRDIYFGAGRFAPATADGRRLLAHELTHVVQQRPAATDAGAAAPADTPVQGDYRERRDKFIERMADKLSSVGVAKLKEALKIGTGGSPKVQAQAKESREWVDRNLNRRVVSRDNPRLPPGYAYRGKGARLRIARLPKFRRLLPGLTIEKVGKGKGFIGIIRFGIARRLYEDLARAELRRNLKCESGKQAHHIIPLQRGDHEVVKAAIKDGWNLNGKENGICLSKAVHDGPHPIYTARVTRDLDNAADELRGKRKLNDPAASRTEVEAVADRHYKQLKRRKEHLD